MKQIQLAALVLLLSFSLSACGIKPKDLSPKSGSEQTEYPRSYPTR